MVAEQVKNDISLQLGAQAAKEGVEAAKAMEALQLTGTHAIITFQCTFCIHQVAAFETLTELASVQHNPRPLYCTPLAQQTTRWV